MSKKSKDIVPLFNTEVMGILQPATPKITAGDSSYKVSTFIKSMAIETRDAASELAAGKRAGEMTVAAYLLLESMHRIGLQSLADTILDSPELLRLSALYCAIGIEAGRKIPEDVEIETEESASNLSLRDLAGKDDKEEDGEQPKTPQPPSD